MSFNSENNSGKEGKMSLDNQSGELSPITKKCKGCGDDFTISVRDQQFLKEQVAKGFWPNYTEPVRCFNCRKQRRLEKNKNQNSRNG